MITNNNNKQEHDKFENLVLEATENLEVLIDKEHEVTSALKYYHDNIRQTPDTIYGVGSVIKAGKVLDLTQLVFKEKGKDFKGYARKHGYKWRNVQKYIRMSHYPEIENYAEFGINKLDFIITAVEKCNYPDSVDDFIDEHKTILEKAESFSDLKKSLDDLTGHKKSVDIFGASTFKDLFKMFNTLKRKINVPLEA